MINEEKKSLIELSRLIFITKLKLKLNPKMKHNLSLLKRNYARNLSLYLQKNKIVKSGGEE